MISEATSPFISAREAADHWRKSPETIYRWAMKFGWEKTFDPNGGILFSREQVLKCGKPRGQMRRAA